MPGRAVQQDAPPKAVSRRRITARKRPSTEEVPDEGVDSSLRRAVCTIFADSQRSTAGHRKCIIALRKSQEQCCYEPVNQHKGKQTDEFDEDRFNNEFTRCVLRILMVRKSEPVGDRVVRFVGTFINAASRKDIELVNQGDPDDTTLPETPTSRLTTHLLNTLLPSLTSKDKTVRFRTTQVISHVVNSLDSLDDNLFHLLRTNLLKRIHDKEGPVRLQAVYGLGRLAAEVDGMEEDDDSDSDREFGSGVLIKLLNVLQNDPSAEVRRNLLLNLPLNKDVLPYLLERARDADAATRRALYARLLPALGDFRHLSLTHREKLLRWGLRDRDDAVRSATARLFRERWIENCAAVPQEQEGIEQAEQVTQAADPSLDALLELLERIDVINSGADGGIALVAMQEFWQGRPDYVDYISFPDTFWQDLTPELAFVARTFNAFCRSPESKPNGPRSLESLLEEKLPEVTHFGAILDRELKILIDTVRQAASHEDVDTDEEAAQREFVVEQMLYMALTFDYSDEVGRRKMFGLMREALALPELPEEVTKLVVEVLRLVCGSNAKGEREFCGVVLEAVAEVHDTIMSDADDADTSSISESLEESFHSANSHLGDNLSGDKKASKKGSKNAAAAAQSEASIQIERERAVREIMVNMKCLHIAQCMLQNVACELEENVHLVTMLNNLIVPAVRSQEAPIRERGLVCLGLCCLLGKNLAEENLTLFMHCFTKGHPALQTIALQVIGDILVTHPTLVSNNKSPDDTTESAAQADSNTLLRQIVKAFSKSLKSGDVAVQATGATALAKTMLSRLITDSDLLKQLVVAYFDPETSGNAQLRQSLSYFLPVYCHSRTENALRMVSVTCPILSKLTTIREAFLDDVADVEEEEGGMVSLTAISNMLVDWTDPRKIYGFDESSVDITSIDDTGEVHFLLAETVLERLVTSQVSKDERKVLLSMLGKLYLPSGGCGSDRLKTILELLTEAADSKVATDATGRNILSKLQTQLLKLMHDAGAGAGETVLESVERPTSKSSVRASSSTMLEQGDTAVEDPVMTQLSNELRESTIGVPDAEGTRMMLHDDDDELLDGSETDS